MGSFRALTKSRRFWRLTKPRVRQALFAVAQNSFSVVTQRALPQPATLSSRTQPRLLRMAVRDLLFVCAGAPTFGFRGGLPFITSRRGEAGQWVPWAICIRGSD
jgi:hypothetical protein